VGGRLETRTQFSLTPGTYERKFDIANSGVGCAGAPDAQNTMTVRLGGLFSENFSRTGLLRFSTITRNIRVLTSTNARLIFDQAGSDNFGIVIERVKLSKLNDTVSISCPADSLQTAIDGALPGNTIAVTGTCARMS
jgi:hypothetical protein